MGVDLYWRPVSGKSVVQNCTGSSQAIKVRDQFRGEIRQDDTQKLRHFYEATGDEVYRELAEIVETNGPIRLEIE